MSRTDRRLVVVLGMHRSGTSAVTHALQVLGVDLGENLMSASSANEKGYFEDLDIHDLNIQLLSALDSDWHALSLIPKAAFDGAEIAPLRSRAIELLGNKLGGRPIAFKDPRVGRLMPFWSSVFHELQVAPSYVLSVRHPSSVVQSLTSIHRLDPAKSYYLWLEHIVPAVLETSGATRVVVDFDRLMADPIVQLGRMAKALNLTFDPGSRDVNEFVCQFLEPRLRHSEFQLANLHDDPDVPADVIVAWETLIQLRDDALDVDSPHVDGVFRQLEGSLRALSPALRYMTRSDKRAAEHIAELDRRISELNRDAIGRTSDIASLNHAVVDRDGQIEALRQVIIGRDTQIHELNLAALSSEARINELNVTIDALNQAFLERDLRITELNQVIVQRNQRVNELNQTIFQRDHAAAERETRISLLEKSIADLLASTSWRLSAPVRYVGRQLLRTRAMFRAMH